MSYGLTNTSTTFSNLMNDVLSDYLDSFLVIFLDDRGVSKWNFD